MKTSKGARAERIVAALELGFNVADAMRGRLDETAERIAYVRASLVEFEAALATEREVLVEVEALRETMMAKAAEIDSIREGLDAEIETRREESVAASDAIIADGKEKARIALAAAEDAIVAAEALVVEHAAAVTNRETACEAREAVIAEANAKLDARALEIANAKAAKAAK